MADIISYINNVQFRIIFLVLIKHPALIYTDIFWFWNYMDNIKDEKNSFIWLKNKIYLTYLLVTSIYLATTDINHTVNCWPVWFNTLLENHTLLIKFNLS